MKYVYRTEPHIARDGTRNSIIWRRRVLSETADQIELGEVERAVIVQGQPAPPFETTGGLLGRPCRITRERYNACGYSTTQPKELTQ
jgi:hypothetical protein